GVDDLDVGLDSGTVTWGHEVQVGYFAQDHRPSIRNGTTVADWLHEWGPQASKEEIRGLLGQMLFSGEEGLKPTDALSGGETAREMSKTTACASHDRPSPTGPTLSAVLNFTLTQLAGKDTARAKLSRIATRKSFNFGRSRITVESTFDTEYPLLVASARACRR